MNMWNDGIGWMFPLLLLLLIAAGAAIFLLARGSRAVRGESRGDPSASALQILNERFARGEIGKQEYQERKAALLTTMAPGGQA